jgi:pimeloyl-ACP methyl ester carboxylesterase
VDGPVSWLLIHGGGATGRFWDRLVPLLDGQVLAPDLPGRRGKPGHLPTLGVEQEVDSLLADVDAAGLADPIVVVAHSSGGLTVPGVVAGLGDRVAAIVLVAASVPPEGGSGLDCMQERHADGVRLAMQLAEEAGEPMLTSGPPADPEKFRLAYGGEPLDDETLAYVTDPERCVVDTMHHYFQPVHWSTVPATIPITYLLTEHDNPVPASKQEEMVARLPVAPTLIRLETGHIPPVTDPELFAAACHEAARIGNL